MADKILFAAHDIGLFGSAGPLANVIASHGYGQVIQLQVFPDSTELELQIDPPGAKRLGEALVAAAAACEESYEEPEAS